MGGRYEKDLYRCCADVTDRFVRLPQELEAMLEQLAQSATEHPADNVHPGRFAVAGDFEKCDATME